MRAPKGSSRRASSLPPKLGRSYRHVAIRHFGSRGAHYTVSRAARWGTAAGEYVERYQNELLVVAMIESVAGLRAAAEIAAVDGVDMLFMGPLDLTADLGCIGRFDDDRVTRALEDLPEALRGSRTWAGSTTLPGVPAGDLIRRGYRFVTVGSDVGMLQTGARAVRTSMPQQ